MAYRSLEENKKVLATCTKSETRNCKLCPYRNSYDIDATKCYDKVMLDALWYMDEQYMQGRIDQAKEDAEYCQKYKDNHNEACLSGDRSKFPINYGTIASICCHMWNRLKELKNGEKKMRNKSLILICRECG